MTIHPLSMRWTGEAMVPLNPAVARNYYDDGDVYRMAPYEQRSRATHNHYFAAVHEGWENLPERYADRWPTAEHLRRYVLIKCGYHDQRSIVAGSKAEAVRLAAFCKPFDDFAVVEAMEATVTVYTARSQSLKAMGKSVFQQSKQAVLDELDAMLGVKEIENGKE